VDYSSAPLCQIAAMADIGIDGVRAAQGPSVMPTSG
jgi:hypothetical protein